MATNVQQSVGPMARGSNAMARTLSRITNPRPTTQEPGMLEATKTSNSGATPGTGVPVASQKSNPIRRGNNLNNNMLTYDSTGIAKKSSTQREKRNDHQGYSNVMRKRTTRKQAKEKINYEKEFNQWLEKGLAVNFADKAIVSTAEIKAALAKFGVQPASNEQKTTGTELNVTMSGVNILGATFNAKKLTLANRTELASKFIVGSKAETTVLEAQWSETSSTGVYACCKEFIRTFKCLIDFTRINISTFRPISSGATKYPFWLGIRVFANKYSNPKAHYPMMLRYLVKRANPGTDVTWDYMRKEVIFGTYSGETKNYKLAPTLKAMAEETDVIIDSMSRTIDQTISAFRNMTAVMQFMQTLDSKEYNASKFAALKKVNDAFTTTIVAVNRECPQLFGQQLIPLLNKEVDDEKTAIMNKEKDILENPEDEEEGN